MTAVSAYRRPASLDEALLLLSWPDTVVLAGGTKLNAGQADGAGPVQVVDLQALGLDHIEALGSGRLRAGSMATLQRIARCPALPSVIREAARREQPSTLRAQATLGGCVAAREADSELLAALLAHDVVLGLASAEGTSSKGLAEFLAGPALAPGRVITDLTIDTSGVASAARTARTRADRPIVAAVARISGTGQRRLALAGVAATPVLVRGPDWTGALDPPGDFRGSAEYRRALAAILARRALEAIS